MFYFLCGLFSFFLFCFFSLDLFWDKTLYIFVESFVFITKGSSPFFIKKIIQIYSNYFYQESKLLRNIKLNINPNRGWKDFSL